MPNDALSREFLDTVIGKCGVAAIVGFAAGHVAADAIAGLRGVIGSEDRLRVTREAFTGAWMRIRGSDRNRW